MQIQQKIKLHLDALIHLLVQLVPPNTVTCYQNFR